MGYFDQDGPLQKKEGEEIEIDSDTNSLDNMISLMVFHVFFSRIGNASRAG